MTKVTHTESGPLRLIVDRDSVAMGDDVESHRQLWELDANTSVAELLSLFATNLLPGVGGFAGWRIYQDVGERAPGWTLGLVYTRDHLRQERYVCLAGEYPRTVGDLAARAPILALHADYLSGIAAQPHTVGRLAQARTWTAAEPVVLEADAQRDAAQDWRLMRRLDTLIKDTHGPRRSWVRRFLRSDAAVGSAQLFAAHSMALVTADLCPASMTIASRDLLGADGRAHDVFAATESRDAALAIAATVFGAFEFGLSRPLRRQTPPSQGRTYLDYLDRHGYRLGRVEQFLAGRLDFTGLRAALGGDSV